MPTYFKKTKTGLNCAKVIILTNKEQNERMKYRRASAESAMLKKLSTGTRHTSMWVNIAYIHATGRFFSLSTLPLTLTLPIQSAVLSICSQKLS